MSPLFVDTGFLIALEALDDQHHAQAVEYWRRVGTVRPRLVTTSFVLDEVVTFFNSRNRHAKAVEIARRLLSSPSVNTVLLCTELPRTASRQAVFADRLRLVRADGATRHPERSGVRCALRAGGVHAQPGDYERRVGGGDESKRGTAIVRRPPIRALTV